LKIKEFMIRLVPLQSH